MREKLLYNITKRKQPYKKKKTVVKSIITVFPFSLFINISSNIYYIYNKKNIFGCQNTNNRKYAREIDKNPLFDVPTSFQLDFITVLCR